MLSRDYIFCDTIQNTALRSVKTITEDLDNGCDLRLIRYAIADLIEHYLHRGKRTNNMAALPHLINAVGSLTLNVNSKKHTVPVGLYACLHDIEKAIGAFKKDAELFRLSVQSLETITYDFLIETLEAIRQTAVFQEKY
jgi:hypothetical protein